MPYPEGITVQHRRPSYGDDIDRYSVYDSHTSLIREVSISYRSLHNARNRWGLIDAAINDAVEYLMHERTQHLSPPAPSEFHYQYIETLVSAEDILQIEPIRLEGDGSERERTNELRERLETKVVKEKIRRNLPS